MRSCPLGVVAILGAVSACGDGGGEQPDHPDAPPATTCADGEVYASFRASPEPISGGRYGSQAGGSVDDAPVPELAATLAEAGGCRFVGPRPVLCTPACTGSDLCDVHGECRPYPTPVAAGTVTITGTDPTITMTPQAGSSYYAQMGYPGLFTTGDSVTLTVEGAATIAPFSITTAGLPAIALPTTMLTAREHADLVIAWTPVTGVPGAETTVELHNDHHAGPQYVQCRADASAGTLTVPAAILDALILAGESGIGTYIESAWIETATRATVRTADGCATFAAQSDEFLQVETIRAPD